LTLLVGRQKQHPFHLSCSSSQNALAKENLSIFPEVITKRLRRYFLTHGVVLAAAVAAARAVAIAVAVGLLLSVLSRHVLNFLL